MSIIFKSWLFKKRAPNKIDSLKKRFKVRLLNKPYFCKPAQILKVNQK